MKTSGDGKGAEVFCVEYLRDFLAVADTLSYTEAARRLYSSQATVSRRVAALERELGVPLFNRTTREVQLSEAGAVAVKYFRQMDDCYKSALEAIDAIRFARSPLRLSCPDYWLGSYIEPLVLFAGQQAFDSGIQLESNSPQRGIELVGSGECDLAFGAAVPTNVDRRIAMRPFAHEQVVAIIWKGSELACRDAVTPEVLKEVPLVLLGNKERDYERMNSALLAPFVAAGCVPEEITYVGQVETLAMALLERRGFTLAPQSVGRLHRDYLVVVPFAEPEPQLPLCLYYRADNLSERVVKFMELAEHFADSRRL